MNEVREYKASIFRKSFNITSLVLNIFHFCLALFYFGMVFVLALLAGFIVLLFEGSMDEFLWPLVWTSVYLIPALLIFVFSIVSTVKCFKYGYKKKFEIVPCAQNHQTLEKPQKPIKNFEDWYRYLETISKDISIKKQMVYISQQIT
jgi:hypothetical protein